MKKFLSLLLSLSMVFTLSIPVFAVVDESTPTIAIDTSAEHMYYDTELNANVIAFTCNSDGTVNYLTKEEADAITNTTDLTSTTAIDKIDTPQPRDYFQYYRFVQTSGPITVTGPLQKVSQDVEYSAGGTHISQTVSTTSTHYFSANVTTSQQESAIQAGATIGWQKSASVSTTFTFDLVPGQKGYIGFYPYYNKVLGDLELHGNWGDGLISSERAAGYSVKLTDNGQADGLFKFVQK